VRRYKAGNVAEMRTLYGPRVVCPRCAKALDRTRIIDEFRSYIDLWVILAVLALVLLLGVVTRL